MSLATTSKGPGNGGEEDILIPAGKYNATTA